MKIKRGLILVASAVATLTLTACGGGGPEHTAADVVSAFEDAGLEVESPTEMTKEDYGMAPMKADEGELFTVPALGDDKGGRILTYSSDSDLEDMKAYYDDLGAESAMFFSWTAAEDNVLIQMNGDMSEKEFAKYEDALNTLGE